MPILIITNGNKTSVKNYEKAQDNIYKPIEAVPEILDKVVLEILGKEKDPTFNYQEWENLPYEPTPTIIEAAKQLYSEHDVKNITKSEGSRDNLKSTRQKVVDIIENSKKNNEKSICFITGVPGAGKTLAGLDIIRDLTSNEKDEDIRSVYLSGNGPLVEVLRESLARDKVKRTKIKKGEADREVKQFIQQLHNYRNDQINSSHPPNEKVIIFDEAQRCWTKEELSKYYSLASQKNV